MEEITVERVSRCENKLTFVLMHYVPPNNLTREVDRCPGSSCEGDISHFCGVTLTSDNLSSSRCSECKRKVLHFAKCLRVASGPAKLIGKMLVQISPLDARVEASGPEILQQLRRKLRNVAPPSSFPLLLRFFREL